MPYNVLIVDDSPIVRKVVEKTLRLSGTELGEVSQAGNGREALDLLKDLWVDIVFADINMPEMDGIEMVERMWQTGLLKTVPVVIVSTERSVTRIEELRAKGVRAYLNKPFTPEEIKTIIDEVLGGRS
ncbi:MAG: response regulator [Verrucomicrobiia bacterium]|jgi:two-component system chemotaxis response regulator CheY